MAKRIEVCAWLPLDEATVLRHYAKLTTERQLKLALDLIPYLGTDDLEQMRSVLYQEIEKRHAASQNEIQREIEAAERRRLRDEEIAGYEARGEPLPPHLTRVRMELDDLFAKLRK